MKRKNNLFFTSALIILCGCSMAVSAVNTVQTKLMSIDLMAPSIVIPPGWQMNDHGKKAVVFGSSSCPGSNGNITTEEGCVIIDNHTATVTVFVVDATAQSQRSETWTIERSAERTTMKRPDKSFVMPWVRESK
ncbi:hypothetical protein SMZ65_004385 [Cronobacter dublinensis]|nr:hypothetical protein [Cronobacter dublinensis]ELY4410092.1 hypothetical protein [Cronobacter dublinensis]ELY4487633.1 hypothetical protein [Cronobacter dublinensis]